MKKIVVIIASIICVFAATSTVMGDQSKLKSAYIADNVKVKVFGTTMETDVIAASRVGESGYRNYVSAADLALYLGYYVDWDGATKTVSVGAFPSYDGPYDAEKLESLKLNIEQNKEIIYGGMSPRMVDSFYKELGYVNKASGGDPLFYMLLAVDDYKTYKSGGKSAFGDYWAEWENLSK